MSALDCSALDRPPAGITHNLQAWQRVSADPGPSGTAIPPAAHVTPSRPGGSRPGFPTTSSPVPRIGRLRAAGPPMSSARSKVWEDVCGRTAGDMGRPAVSGTPRCGLLAKRTATQLQKAGHHAESVMEGDTYATPLRRAPGTERDGRLYSPIPAPHPATPSGIVEAGGSTSIYARTPAMQTPHPLDDLGLVRRLLVRAFIGTHNEIDATERAALDAFDRERDDLLIYRRRQAAAASFERNGDSRITRDRFHEAGLQLVRPQPKPAHIVRFPTGHEQSAG